MGKKVLITGGAGFIGSYVVDRHLAEGNQVVVVDDLSTGNKENIPVHEKNILFFDRDITDHQFIESLLREHDFDIIYLLAAIASVPDTIDHPYSSHIVNQEANLFILEALRVNDLHPDRVIFSSSAATYGLLPELPKSESGAVLPATPYAIDKYATERYVLTYSSLYKIPTVAVRFFNVYGPRQNPHSTYSGVLSIVSNALLTGDTFKLFGDGLQTRDFVYVKDVVTAMKIAEQDDRMIGEVFNIATGSAHTLLEIIEDFEIVSNRKLDMQIYPERFGDIKYSMADISRLRAFGYEPSYSLLDGLKEYWESL